MGHSGQFLALGASPLAKENRRMGPKVYLEISDLIRPISNNMITFPRVVT